MTVKVVTVKETITVLRERTFELAGANDEDVFAMAYDNQLGEENLVIEKVDLNDKALISRKVEDVSIKEQCHSTQKPEDRFHISF